MRGFKEWLAYRSESGLASHSKNIMKQLLRIEFKVR